MSETAILGVLISALGACIAAIYGIFSGRQRTTEAGAARQGERIGQLEAALAVLKSQNERQERDVVALQAQNTGQESTLSALTQRMIAREDAHASHREDVVARMGRIEDKLDRLIGSKTPWPGGPGSYSRGEGSGGKGG